MDSIDKLEELFKDYFKKDKEGDYYEINPNYSG